MFRQKKLIKVFVKSYIILNKIVDRTNSIIKASRLQIQMHGYSSHFDFIILFVTTLPLNVISLEAVSCSHIHHVRF